MKELMSGNEAIARGAYEYGVRLASAYPGTPSTEILETIGAKYPDIKAGWAPNEKVAVEVAGGAALGGARALACMKHVGLNVAADPFMIYSYTGVYGGFVIVVCDDPEMHSSQNEQDTRNYAKFAKVPCIVPADSQEAKDMVGEALRISEQFDTRVLLLGSTRISHSMSLVEIGKHGGAGCVKAQKEPRKGMLPGFARRRHPLVDRGSWTWRVCRNLALQQNHHGRRRTRHYFIGRRFQYAREALRKLRSLN